jgi:hypothetical protein
MDMFRATRCTAISLALALPAVAAAQTPAASPPEIENYAGIFFFCKPLANEAWTPRACEQMGSRMAEFAARAKKPIVLMKIGDTRDKYPGLAKAQGFDSTKAIWFLITIDPHPGRQGQWEVAARADGTAKPTSPNAQPQVVTYSKKADVASSAAVAEKGSELLSAIMSALTTPMRPL